MSEIYQTGSGARVPQGTKSERRTAEVVGGGSSAAALCGLGAAVLGIVGLAGIYPLELCAVAILAAGAGFVFQGGAIAARYQQMRDNIVAAEGERGEKATETGMTSEMVGGVGAIVLGILALIHIVPMTLIAVSAIVLGGTLLLGSGASYETIEMAAADQQNFDAVRTAHRAASSAAGVDVLMGLGAVTLGILAVIGVGSARTSPDLALIALLVVGVGQLVTDTTLAARMTSIFRHGHR